MEGSQSETRRDPGRNWAQNLNSHRGTLKSLGYGNLSIGEGDPKSGCLSLAHTLLGLHRTGGEEEVAQGCGCYLWTSSAVLKPEEPKCAAESPGSLPPFPECSHPLQLFGVRWKSPLRPSSYKPSHGLTFVLSNRSDLLPASMAVFKVHLWGTQTDCSDKARHGAVCDSPGFLGPWLGWGWGGLEQRPTCVQDEAALRLLPPVAWPGGQPSRERPQPQGRGVFFGLGPASPAG